jgi:outer membrane protein insertion porin family
MIRKIISVDVVRSGVNKVLSGGSRLFHGCFPRFYMLLLLCCVLSFLADAQPLLLHAEDRFSVRQVQFEGNNSFSNARLRDVVEIRPSPSRFSSWLNTRISDKLGSPPSYFDYYQVTGDIERLRDFYNDNGFFRVKIDTALNINYDREYVYLKFLINEGRRSIIDTIIIRGLDYIDPVAYDRIMTGRVLQQHTNFRRDLLELEYRRILNILYNSGYAKASVDSVNVPLFLSTGNVHIIMSYTPGDRFEFGDITIQIEEDKGYRIGPSIIYRQLEFDEGDIYSLGKRTESERNLNRLGIFESAKIDIRIPSGEDTMNTIPSSVVVRPRNKHEITPEIIVNDENNAFNIGLGIGYANRNYMGGARILSLRTRFRIQSIQELQLVRVWNENGLRDPSVIGGIEIGTELQQPYIITNKTTGRWGVAYQLEKQDIYQVVMLRNRIGINHEFSPTTYGFFDWTLERVNVRILQAGADPEIDPRRSRILQFRGPQLNSIIALTLQHDKTDDIFSPTRGHMQSVTFEEGGVLPQIFRRLGDTLPYSQYIKTTYAGRLYVPVDRRRYHILALKLQIGYGTLYARGNDTPIPIHRRYYAGGSGSVRGWKTRQLGTMEDPTVGGNVLLEGNIESRINMLRNLGELPIDFRKLWGVVFVDYGNVWDRGRQIGFDEIALATGVGLRYDTLIGPIRIDFGWKLYDPKTDPGNKWLFERTFFRDITLHFGIGHAF